MQNGLVAARMIFQHISLNVKVLPTDQSLHSSHLQSSEGILHTETEFPRILTDLVKVLPNEPLLLDKLDVGE